MIETQYSKRICNTRIFIVMVAQLFSTAGGYELSAQDTGDVASYKSTFAIRNVRLFIAFRVFFNARFYYPVFTILFLDFGLTLEQFALLNAAWAAAIVLLEVPSGARWTTHTG